jgi:hypothetical protein
MFVSMFQSQTGGEITSVRATSNEERIPLHSEKVKWNSTGDGEGSLDE